MVRARLSAEQEVDNLNRRASEARQALLRKKLEMAVKNKPEVIEPLYEKLRSLGYDDEALKTKTAVAAPSRQKEAVESRKKRRVELKEEHDNDVTQCVQLEESDGAPSLPTDPVPTKIRTMAAFTVGLLQDRVLSKLGANMSSGNLRSLRGEEGRKQALMQIVEFGTGYTAETRIEGRLRCFNKLAAEVQQRPIQRGRRSVLLCLPVDWDAQGLIEIVGYGAKDGSVRVRHRYLGEEATIDAANVPPHNKLPDLQAVRRDTCHEFLSGRVANSFSARQWSATVLQPVCPDVRSEPRGSNIFVWHVFAGASWKTVLQRPVLGVRIWVLGTVLREQCCGCLQRRGKPILKQLSENWSPIFRTAWFVAEGGLPGSGASSRGGGRNAAMQGGGETQCGGHAGAHRINA